jgi:hypothetical protein
MSSRSVRVSDHALVLFLARAGGFEVEALRGALEGSLNRAVMAATAIGETEFTVHADGLRYVVNDGVLVTIEQVRRPSVRKRSRR